MSKQTREQKIEIYEKRKSGTSYSQLSLEYKIGRRNMAYLVNLIDKHGTELLRNIKNRRYSMEFKEQAVQRVLKIMKAQIV